MGGFSFIPPVLVKFVQTTMIIKRNDMKAPVEREA